MLNIEQLLEERDEGMVVVEVGGAESAELASRARRSGMELRLPRARVVGVVAGWPWATPLITAREA